jgi:hypothetical protein
MYFGLLIFGGLKRIQLRLWYLRLLFSAVISTESLDVQAASIEEGRKMSGSK